LGRAEQRFLESACVKYINAKFELASTVFFDPQMLTVADVEHGDTGERWSSVGIAGNGVLLSLVYLWSDADPAAIKVRLISARRATQAERAQY
jgi:uncharacterized DUF497 family protein